MYSKLIGIWLIGKDREGLIKSNKKYGFNNINK